MIIITSNSIMEQYAGIYDDISSEGLPYRTARCIHCNKIGYWFQDDEGYEYWFSIHLQEVHPELNIAIPKPTYLS